MIQAKNTLVNTASMARTKLHGLAATPFGFSSVHDEMGSNQALLYRVHRHGQALKGVCS